MKNITKEIIKDAVIVTLVISYFTITGHVKPMYQEFETVALTNNGSSSLELGDVSMIACYGAQGNNSEFYLNNALLTDLSDYVIHKELDFSSTEENGKLKLSEINLSDDILNSALCMKVKLGTEWLEIRDLTKFDSHTFNSIGETEIWIWYELCNCTKENIIASNGTDIEIVFEVE